MLRSIACIWVSPFDVFFSHFIPAVATNWQNSVLVVNVEFDVGVVAFSVPRVFA
jgi:hypothetical protein